MAVTAKNGSVLLTGGAGFIGSHLVRALAPDCDVSILDKLTRPARARLGHSLPDDVEFQQGDVLDAVDVRKAAEGKQTLIHLAAVAGIDTVIKDPIHTMDVNYEGTRNVLQAASATGVRRVISFSTSEVYGPYVYMAEEAGMTTVGGVGNPRWTYAVSKLAAEHYAIAFAKHSDIEVIIVRPFNIYGPGQVGEGAIQSFILQALRNEDITIFGSGAQIRAWCYIDDLVSAVVKLLACDVQEYAVFNIGNPQAAVTVRELADRIVALSGSASRIRQTRRDYSDVLLRVPDISQAQRALGFDPSVQLDEGLTRTIAWYRRVLERKPND